MRVIAKTLAFVAVLLLFSASAFAQATLAGSVKDSSGAVLPGVSVEAASPALIEKTRTAFTDGTGQYRIEDLRPGTYTVTFTLRRTGFDVRRSAQPARFRVAKLLKLGRGRAMIGVDMFNALNASTILTYNN